MEQKKIESVINLLQSELLNRKLTIEAARQTFDDIYLRFCIPVSSVIEKTSTINGINVVKYTSSNFSADSVIVFLHGGGFTLGSSMGHRDFIHRVAVGTKTAVLSIDYRLAPEFCFPAPIDDTLKVYEYLLSEYDFNKIIFMGMTAGGTIVLSSLIEFKKVGLPMPRAAVCLSPPVDLSFTNESIDINAGKDWVMKSRLLTIQQSYLKNTLPGDPKASPYFADLMGLPPLLIQVGSSELLLDDSVKFCEKAELCGVEAQLQVWEGMIHSWHMFSSTLYGGRKAIKEICDFVQLSLHKCLLDS